MEYSPLLSVMRVELRGGRFCNEFGRVSLPWMVPVSFVAVDDVDDDDDSNAFARLIGDKRLLVSNS